MLHVEIVNDVCGMVRRTVFTTESAELNKVDMQYAVLLLTVSAAGTLLTFMTFMTFVTFLTSS